MLRHKFYGTNPQGFNFKMSKRRLNNSKKRCIITSHHPIRAQEKRPINTRMEPRKNLESTSFEEIDQYSGTTFDKLASLRSELLNINNRLNKKEDSSFNESRQNSKQKFFDSCENAAKKRPSTKGYMKLELDPIDHERAKMKLKLLLEKQLLNAKGKRKLEIQRRLEEMEKREVKPTPDVATSDYNYSKILKLSGLSRLDNSVHSRVRNLRQNNSESRGTNLKTREKSMERFQIHSQPKHLEEVLVRRTNTSKNSMLKAKIFKKKISCDFRNKKKPQSRRSIVLLEHNKMIASKIISKNNKEMPSSYFMSRRKPVKKAAKNRQNLSKKMCKISQKQPQGLSGEDQILKSLETSIVNCELPCKASPSPMGAWEDKKTLIIDDFEQSDRDFNKSVDCVKQHLEKFIGRKKILCIFERIQCAKAHILALVKGYKARKYFRAVKKAAKIIQKRYRLYKSKQKLKAKQPIEPKTVPEITQEISVEDIKRQRQIEFIRKQREMTQLKKKKREAVLIIEKWFHRKIIRKKYCELRQKLAKIPKEMRIVYFKYMALRSDTNNLINEFNDAMDGDLMSHTNFFLE
ncbi:unnamed protein product [Moneuplotes crassus]|uniref:Uncharacterized protein n=1 Tax=Euplotes crassus TaxID=5936 RepID=A0AAD1U8T6_EUPCR|nr:unnamed protein product [Moneuplotes crassus]